ncbi:hypothetical protein RB597_002642 [Gaeumannomyces tritici]
MAIQFCDDCGDTLPITADRNVKCDCCGKMNKSKAFLPCLTKTLDLCKRKGDGHAEGPVPSLYTVIPSLAGAGTGQEKTHSREENHWPSIEQDCQFCDAKEIRYTTLQTRGADEGSTVFYFCPKCKQRYKENN